MMEPDEQPLAVLNIASTLAETARLHGWLDTIIAEAGLSEKTGFAVRLCLEEAVMNIILHGYGEDTPGAIELAIWISPLSVLVRIADRAPPFNPTVANGADVSETLGADQVGGRGLKLIRRFAAVIRYERIAGENRLTLGIPVSSG